MIIKVFCGSAVKLFTTVTHKKLTVMKGWHRERHVRKKSRAFPTYVLLYEQSPNNNMRFYCSRSGGLHDEPCKQSAPLSGGDAGDSACVCHYDDSNHLGLIGDVAASDGESGPGWRAPFVKGLLSHWRVCVCVIVDDSSGRYSGSNTWISEVSFIDPWHLPWA